MSLLLGILIAAGLPGTAAWALGLMVGINLLFTGFALVSLARALRAGNANWSLPGGVTWLGRLRAIRRMRNIPIDPCARHEPLSVQSQTATPGTGAVTDRKHR